MNSNITASGPEDTPAKDGKKMPGDEGVWIIIFGDMMVFGLFFATYLYYRSLNVDMYTAAQSVLSKSYGLINTLILLTSSWFVVWAIACFKNGNARESSRRLIAAIALGLAFWIIKILEYSEKIAAGHTLTKNEFFGFYYMFTGIHLVHVTVGIGALLYAVKKTRNSTDIQLETNTLVSIGVFWHMVDLLWIILFALLYLVS